MRKSCRVHVNDQGFTARRGELLLDAALVNGVDMPHDCRSGVCGSCKVRVLDGVTIGGESEEAGMVKACQARVITDLNVLVEPVPEVLTTRGTVMDITPLAPDVVEVRIRPSEEISYLPGQYCRFQFRGFPWRYFSPTAPLDRPFDGRTVRLHVRRIECGRVSPALGREIRPGHPVTFHGPFGTAYLRPGQSNRLVLIGSGTGFAPIWSIAEAAIAENPERRMVVIVGAKTLPSLYMASAFRWLKNYPNVQLIPTVSEKTADAARVVRQGRPADFMPKLSPGDIVHACGAPQMVDAVKEITADSGCTFHADPFTPQHAADGNGGIVERALTWLNGIVPIPGRTGGEQARMLPKPPMMPRPPGQQSRAAPPRYDRSDRQPAPVKPQDRKVSPPKPPPAPGVTRQNPPPAQGQYNIPAE